MFKCKQIKARLHEHNDPAAFPSMQRTRVLGVLVLDDALGHPHLHALLPVGLGLHVLGQVSCKAERQQRSHRWEELEQQHRRSLRKSERSSGGKAACKG